MPHPAFQQPGGLPPTGQRPVRTMIDTKARNDGGIIPAFISKDQARDTGMAMTLICLITAALTKNFNWMYASIGVLVLDMTAPVLFKPLGYVWFGLSRAMGAVVSRVLLAVIFFVMVTPVGLLRRAMGKDTLRLRQWKKSRDSVFVTRDHAYTPQDIEQPF